MSSLIPFVAFALFFLGVWLIVHFALRDAFRLGAAAVRRFMELLLRQRFLSSWYLAQRTRFESARGYIPLLIILVVGILLTGLAGDAFLELAENLRANNAGMLQFDHSVHDWVRSLYGQGSTRFFVTFTTIGSPITLGLLFVFVQIVLLAQKKYRWAVYLLITSAGGAALNLELKRFFARSRPELSVALRQASGFSFPSGHAMGSAVFFSALAYLAVRSLKSWNTRSAVIALAISIITAVSLSRVYLGVHWTSDIAAGVSAGMLWFGSTTIGYEAIRRIRRLHGRRMVSPASTEIPRT
ncbi:MAG: phosphatase PAP2 family protein [Acidobacteriota bacterium]